MSGYNETKPLAELIALKARIALKQEDFTDVDGNHLDLGYPVQYIREREDWEEDDTVWNPERWGIVIDLIHTPKWDYVKREESETEFDVQVKVAHPNVVTSRTGPGHERSHDVFTCDVKSVRVIQ